MAAIVRVRDDNGNVFDIPALVGPKGDPGKDAVGTPGKDGAPGKSAYEYAKEAGYTGTEAEFSEKLAEEVLLTTTAEVTPTQVWEAVSSGREVMIAHGNKAFGMFCFTSFNTNANLHLIFSSSILQYNGMYAVVELIGNMNTDTWDFVIQQIPIMSDIPIVPTALKNPNALTINGVAYDGSSAVSVETPKMLVVTLDNDIASKTSGEIIEAIAAGYTVFFNNDGVLVPFLTVADGMAMFMTTLSDAGAFFTLMVVVAQDGTTVTDSVVAETFPNPESMTINGVEYNGTYAKDFTNTINAMIDAKLGVIENGSY